MIALGVDTGASTGLTVIDCRAMSCLYRLTATPAEVPLALREILARWPIGVVGIETPSEVFTHGRGKESMGARIGIERALLAARDVAGVVRGTVIALSPSTPIHDGQAHECRKIVGRMKRGKQDAFVKTFVHGAIPDWARGKGDNDHNRDAAVAALWAARKERLK